VHLQTQQNLENQQKTTHLKTELRGAGLFCYLITIFRIRIAESVSATTNTTVIIFCSLLLLLVPAAVDLHGMKTMPGTINFLAIGYYGVFATVFAYLLWTAAVGEVSGATAGAATAAMPASALFLAAIILEEPLLWYHLVGCLMIVVGIVVTTNQPQELKTIPVRDRSSR
jgi:drug/metabolite transporter (DMT)-like permease